MVWRSFPRPGRHGRNPRPRSIPFAHVPMLRPAVAVLTEQRDMAFRLPVRPPSDPVPEQMQRPSFGERSPDTGKDSAMIKTRTLDTRIMRRTVAVAAMALLA